MKKIISLISAAVLLVTSCTLEQELYDKINPGIFPKTPSDVESMVNASAYFPLSAYGVFGVAAGYITNSEMVTDYVENTWGWTTVYNSYEANDWHIDGDYRRVYDFQKYLASMTLTMDRISAVPMEKEMYNRFIGELKCGRGFLAFLLYDMYGPIPLADLETLKNPSAEKILPRATDEEMCAYIETNLKEAAELLPYSYSESDYGRFTKGLANTLLMKFYMLKKQWKDAEAIGRELLLPEYGYKLEEDYNKLFSLAGERSPEIIYSCQCAEGVVEHQWLAHVLTSDYPLPEGVNATAWGGYKISWPMYESFEPGDRRLARLIGDYVGSDGVRHNRQTDRDGGKKGILYYGAIPIKYAIEGVVGEKCEIDMPIYRYADVLTMLSEAIVRNQNSISPEAVRLLNQVRVTHGGLAPYQVSDFLSVEEFLDTILDERGHEFYFEGVRRQDLIRHGKFIEAAIRKAEFAGMPTGKITTQVDGHYKYELLPIPTKIIVEGQGVIKQNPGY